MPLYFRSIGSCYYCIKPYPFFIGLIFLFVSNQHMLAQTDSLAASILSELASSDFTSKQQLNNNFDLLEKSEHVLSDYNKKKYYKIGLESATDNSLEFEISNYAEALGTIYETSAKTNEDLDSAIYYYNRFLQSAIVQDAVGRQARAYNCLGSVYQTISDIKNALDHFHLSIEAYKKSDQPKGIAYPLSNISYIYLNLGDIPNAIRFTKEGLQISQSLSEPERLYNTIFKCGDLILQFQMMEVFDSARVYLEYGLAEVQKMEAKPKSIRNQGVLFNFYQSSIDYFIEVKNFEEAEKFYQKISANRHIDSGWGALLKIRYALGTDNIESLDTLINNAPSFLTDPEGPYYHRYISHREKYFERIGLAKEAYADLKIINDIESKNHKENAKIYSEYMNSKFALVDSDHKVQLLSKQNQLKSFQTKMALVGGLFFILSSLFLYRQKRKIADQNKILKKQSNTIKEQSNKILSQTESKEQLFANISHELRTPLTLISSPINQLLKNDTQSKELNLISRYSNQLLTLTDQILDVTKNNFEGIKLNYTCFKIDALITYIQNEFELNASELGIQLVFVNNLPANFSVVTDTDKLITIIKNLISNALKYSEGAGTITSKFELDNEILLLEFTDTGQGISKEDITHIFDRFFQSSNNSASSGGVGLGLAICKDYVEKLGGSISVTSTETEGAQFSISLPIKTDTKSLDYFPYYEFPKIFSLQDDFLPILNDDDLPDEYLLIVEDNLDLCKHLKGILEEDYQLSFAHNGGKALNQINSKIPKVIISDWMMPGIDGKELVQMLKSNEEFASIPILMLTARNHPEDRLSILRIGVDDYITKPFVPDSLKAHINHLVELSDSRLSEEQENNEFSGFKQTDLLFLKELEKVTLKNISDFDFTLSTISTELKISPRQLNRKVKGLTGLTPKQYVTEFRFKEAKRLLETKAYSTVKAVIYSVGFKAEQNFSRNFKKRFGKYPKEILY